MNLPLGKRHTRVLPTLEPVTGAYAQSNPGFEAKPPTTACMTYLWANHLPSRVPSCLFGCHKQSQPAMTTVFERRLSKRPVYSSRNESKKSTKYRICDFRYLEYRGPGMFTINRRLDDHFEGWFTIKWLNKIMWSTFSGHSIFRLSWSDESLCDFFSLDSSPAPFPNESNEILLKISLKSFTTVVSIGIQEITLRGLLAVGMEAPS